MGFPSLEPTTPHLVYLILSVFLILYALFAELIRNRLHLSEPPLALFVGILFGGLAVDILGPISWRFQDDVTQEITRVVVGLQVFTVGLDLPAGYMKRHWKPIAVLLGPNMLAGWFISATILYVLLKLKFTTALIIAATLTPTDPVLSASVLGEAKFSQRIPSRLRQLLSAESGCNDGSAFPILYAALFAVTKPSAGSAIKWWFIEVILWQCLLGIIVGAVIGFVANRLLKFSERRGYMQDATLIVFYFLLAIFTIGVGSTLALDDFLVAFSAGTAFSWDGWFAKKTHKMKLPSIIDLILNSTMFVYFGTLFPWKSFQGQLNIGAMIGCVVLILLLRRIPLILALKNFIPGIQTYNEALFAGHFGPMGVGALFLAIEARARLETGSSEPMPHPPLKGHPHQEAIDHIWPVVCFIVLGSIIVHGFSAIVMSLYGHFTRPKDERAPLLGGETDRLYGMAGENGSLTDGSDDNDQEDEDETLG